MTSTLEHGVNLTDEAKAKVEALISAENPVDADGNPVSYWITSATEYKVVTWELP